MAQIVDLNDQPWPMDRDVQSRYMLETQRALEEQRQYEDRTRQRPRWPTEPLPKTIGSARVIDGTLKLMFTDGTRIDIPMAVVSEIVAVVLAGRLAMGLSEAEPAP